MGQWYILTDCLLVNPISVAVALMGDLENLGVDGVGEHERAPLLFAWGKIDLNLKKHQHEQAA